MEDQTPESRGEAPGVAASKALEELLGGPPAAGLTLVEVQG